MENELKTRPCLKPVFEFISNTDANFLDLHILIKQQKHVAKNNNLITHFTKQTLNLAVDFRPKMALTLEILSEQMHTLPRNSAEHTLFFFFASFRRSKSALCHLKNCS